VWSKNNHIYYFSWEITLYILVEFIGSEFVVAFNREDLKKGSICSPKIEVSSLENFFFSCVTKQIFSSKVLEIFTKLHCIESPRAQTVYVQY